MDKKLDFGDVNQAFLNCYYKFVDRFPEAGTQMEHYQMVLQRLRGDLIYFVTVTLTEDELQEEYSRYILKCKSIQDEFEGM